MKSLYNNVVADRQHSQIKPSGWHLCFSTGNTLIQGTVLCSYNFSLSDWVVRLVLTMMMIVPLAVRRSISHCSSSMTSHGPFFRKPQMRPKSKDNITKIVQRASLFSISPLPRPVNWQGHARWNDWKAIQSRIKPTLHFWLPKHSAWSRCFLEGHRNSKSCPLI